MRAAALAFVLTTGSAAAFDRLEGHGGPVMDVTVAVDTVLTASFDYSVGEWHGGKPTWLEGHHAVVNTVVALPGQRAASGGDDGAVIVWDLGSDTPLHRLEAHEAKVADIAASPDGTTLASAGWDGSVRLWDIEAGRPGPVLRGHEGPVNAVAWDDLRLLSGGADGTLLSWDLEHGVPERVLARHGFGINRIAVGPGWLVYGAVDGSTIVLDTASGQAIADLSAGRRPILALATAPRLLAVGDGEGHILVVETKGWSVLHDFRAAVNGPIWALAFTADGQSIIAGGIDDSAVVWPLGGGGPRIAEAPRPFHTDPATVGNGERQFLRKCSVCHTLTPDGGRRAGPSLHNLFGREAGSVPGYSYSRALADSGIVWTPETVDLLFSLGPDHYTPGSKMPMQRITAPKDRADLIAFLRDHTTQGEPR